MKVREGKGEEDQRMETGGRQEREETGPQSRGM